MEILEERMISRFLSGMTIDIQQPAYETRVAILYKKAEELNLAENAKSAILLEASTGEIIFEKNSHILFPTSCQSVSSKNV